MVNMIYHDIFYVRRQLIRRSLSVSNIFVVIVASDTNVDVNTD